MKRFIYILALVGFLIFPTSSSFAGSQSGKSIKIAFGNWPPFLDPAEPQKGVYSQLIKDAFETQGYTVEIQFHEWDKAMELVKSGDIELSGLWLKTPEREMIFHYSSPILNETHVFFHNRKTKFEWNRIEDLKGRNLIGLKGFNYGSKLDYMIREKQVSIELVENDQEAFTRLLKNPELICPQELNVGLNILKKKFSIEDADKIAYIPKTFNIATSYLICAKKVVLCSKYILDFNRGLKETLGKQMGKNLLSTLKSLPGDD